MKRRGRGQPTRLTEAVSKTICDAVRAGWYLTTAARAAGVSTDALAEWRTRGARGEEPFASFAKAFDEAELDCENALVKIWHDAAPTDWRAARDLLARRFPERWSQEAQFAGSSVGSIFEIQINLSPVEDEQEQQRQAIPIEETTELPPSGEPRS